MPTKTVTTRKEHLCACCGKRIKKGETVEYGEAKNPVFDNDEGVQTGIEYVKWYLCKTCMLEW